MKNHPVLYILCLCLAFAEAANARNLVSNPSCEEKATSGSMPSNWRGWAPHEGADFRIDSKVAHTGTHSATVETTSDQIAMLVTDLIPVAPGEMLHVSCWFRTQNIHSSSGGSLILTTEFVDRNGAYFTGDHKRVQPIDQQDTWFEVTNDVVVPERAALVAIEPGIRLMTGQMWADDVIVTSSQSAAIRFDVPRTVFEPGEIELPMALINRTDETGRAFEIQTEPGGQRTKLQAGKQIETKVRLLFKFTKRGETMASARLISSQPGEQDFETSIACSIPELLVAEPLVPTHWIVEETEAPRFDARFWVHEPAASRNELSAKCVIIDNMGKTLTEQVFGAVTTQSIAFQMQLPKPIQDPTTFTAHLVLKRGDQIAAEADLPWRFIHRDETIVTIGDDGYPRVHGKRFFPIGFYMAGHWQELKDSGFNVVQTYDAFTVEKGEEPNNNAILDFLDHAHRMDLKALVFVNHGLTARLDRDESLRRIRMFRNHPASLVWYEGEAVVRGIKPLSWLAELVGDMRREGPGHPVLIGDQSDEGHKVPERGNSLPVYLMDVGEWWWYPTPPHDAPPVEDYEGEKAGPDLEYVPPAFLRKMKTKKPLWVAMQCYRKPESDARYPTPEEYRCQAYIALIHGAKGLFYYCGYDEDGGGIFLHPKEGHWEELKQVVRELRSIDSVIMSPDAKEQITCDESMISLRTKQVDSHRVLLAVNRCNKPQHGEFHVPGFHHNARVEEHFQGRTVQGSSNGDFNYDFAPYAVHVFYLESDSM